LGSRKGIRPVKTEWWGAGVVICLERDADLHMAQLMPLPLTVSCFSKIQIGFIFLVLAYPGSPGKRAVKLVCVCVCIGKYLVMRMIYFATFTYSAMLVFSRVVGFFVSRFKAFCCLLSHLDNAVETVQVSLSWTTLCDVFLLI